MSTRSTITISNNKPGRSSLGLDAVNVSFLDKQRHVLEAGSSPIVISPRWDDSLSFLTQWLTTNRPWVDEQLIQYGAVYVRGFNINTPVDFEAAVSALQPALCDAYRGTSPRSLKEGCKFVFSAADVPVNYPIAQHCEMSMLKAPPRQLYFGCMKASSKPGGETALCDFRKVYRDLDPALREKLQTKKIKYTRTHARVGEKYTYDVGAMLGWPQLFGCDSKDEVERICKEEDAPAVQWTGRNSDTFTQEWIDEPFQVHPVTGEMVWFNHSQVFHWTTFPMELLHSFSRIKDINLILHFIMVSVFCFIKYGLLGFNMALNTTFGDGAPLTFLEMCAIRNVIHKNMIYSRWEKGDILAIDNFSTSHGRQPTYDRSRQVIVAWSQPHPKGQMVVSEDTAAAANVVAVQPEFVEVSEKNPAATVQDDLPELAETTPDNSIQSTLTSDEARELKEAFLGNRFHEEMAQAFSMLKASKKDGLHKRQSSCPAPALQDVFSS